MPGPERALALLVLAALVGLRLWDPAPVESLRLRTFDLLQALHPRPVTARPVTVVAIDEESLRAYGPWPWARTRVAAMVRQLTEAGAAAVAFDMVFPEPDRFSPARVADGLDGLDPAARAALAGLPDNDAVLAEAIRAGRVILGQSALERAAADEPGLPRTDLIVRGPDPAARLARFPGLRHNLPELERAAAGRGFLTLVPERDGIVRRVPLAVQAGGRLVPGLALEVLRVLTGGTLALRTDAAGAVALVLPGFEIPTDATASVRLHVSDRDPARSVPARAVLDGSLDPDRVAQKIVLVGITAPGLADGTATPVGRGLPGVEVQAQLLESLLSRATLAYPDGAVAAEILLALGLSLAAIVLMPRLGAARLLAPAAALALALAATVWFRFERHGLLLDATFPLGASLAVCTVLVVAHRTRARTRRQRIRAAFGRRLAPARVERLAARPETVSPGGEARRLTVLVSVVRGLADLAEASRDDPAGPAAPMRRVLSPLTAAILDGGGTLDRSMGGTVTAYWNAPLDDPDHEADACAAALAMVARFDALVALDALSRAGAVGGPVPPVEIGIGLDTGRCVVGDVGSGPFVDYAVLGESVDAAFRLEALSQAYRVRTVLGAAVAAAVADRFAVLEIDRVRVKGRAEAEAISTLVGDADVRDSPAFRRLAARHAEMLVAYRRRDWASTRGRISACRSEGAAFGLGGLYDLYLERVAAFERAPPPLDGSQGQVARAK